MSFIEVERSVRPSSWTMQGLHAHPHYEIYYLYQGSRQLLLANALYHMEAPSLAVIPPGAPHKTEGGPFARFNINVSPDYANPFQREVLQARALGAVPLSPEEHSAMFPLLEDLERCPPGSRHSGYVIQAFFGYLVVLLSRVEAASHQGLTVERPPAAAGAEGAGLPVQPLPGKPEPGQPGGPVLCVQSHHPLQL